MAGKILIKVSIINYNIAVSAAGWTVRAYWARGVGVARSSCSYGFHEDRVRNTLL